MPYAVSTQVSLNICIWCIIEAYSGWLIKQVRQQIVEFPSHSCDPAPKRSSCMLSTPSQYPWDAYQRWTYTIYFCPRVGEHRSKNSILLTKTSQPAWQTLEFCFVFRTTTFSYWKKSQRQLVQPKKISVLFVTLTQDQLNTIQTWNLWRPRGDIRITTRRAT